jgi:NAD(P)-dependent dehydrogenase (short-subunit alcohol dehydrogenase family)
MSERLSGKVAIITGGASGIGRATAILFAEEGARVVIADVNETAGARVAAEIEGRGGKALFVPTDVAQEADARRACERTLSVYGQLDILVNSAAIFSFRGLTTSVAEWQRSLSVNVIGTALMSRHAADAMKNRGGAIVNLGSISSFVAQPSFIPYSATKAAIVQMTRNMAMDLAPFNIRVNCVCPGTILTPASDDYVKQAGMNLEQYIAAESEKTLLKRVGQPREVACAILFLASDEASFITGTYLLVDGGYTAK